jgi:hypothetical protein
MAAQADKNTVKKNFMCISSGASCALQVIAIIIESSIKKSIELFSLQAKENLYSEVFKCI